MRVNVGTATDNQLDWMVAMALGLPLVDGLTDDERYTTNWAIGGPIIAIHKEDDSDTRMEFRVGYGGMYARYPEKDLWFGRDYLVAGMRCFVAARLGPVVEVPDGLE